jgi:hypothetical protein
VADQGLRPAGTAADRAGTITIGHNTVIKAYQPAQIPHAGDHAGTVTLGHTTVVRPHQATDAPSATNNGGATALAHDSEVASHEAADIIAGSIDIHGLQKEIRNHSRCV